MNAAPLTMLVPADPGAALARWPAYLSTVRPGNSGGPLLTTDGPVYGTVFARSATHPNSGSGLSADLRTLAAQPTHQSGRGPCPRSRRIAPGKGGDFPPRILFVPDGFLLFSRPRLCVKVGIEYFSPLDHALVIPVRGH